MPVDRKSRMMMGALGLLASVLLVAAAYFSYQANLHLTEAANVRDGTALEPGLPMGMILELAVAVIFGLFSLRILTRSRRDEQETS